MAKRLSHQLDMNLLEVLLAIRRCRNLTSAGQELGLSQPAVSRALMRLREAYNDPLFVRHPHGVVPTPFADQLCVRIHDALDIVKGTFQQPAFSPRTEARTFVLAMSDISEQVFLPELATYLAGQAPGVKLRTSQLQGKSLKDGLASGHVDLALGYLGLEGDGIVSERLFSARYACIARRDHPKIGRSLSAQNFRELGHIIADGSMTAHAHVLERFLSSTEIAATIALRVGHFLSVGRIVAHTDFIATIPRSLARTFETAWQVTVHEPPLRLPKYDVFQFWHERYDREAGLMWLRGVIATLFKRRGQSSRA